MTVFWRFRLFPGRSKLLKMRGPLRTETPDRVSKSVKLTVPPRHLNRWQGRGHELGGRIRVGEGQRGQHEDDATQRPVARDGGFIHRNDRLPSVLPNAVPVKR
jgi:hypothetical protein